ncbi:isoaspartyl peptidase/L-asparaginase family protein [Glaciecola sp. SC05]|uniref:isoaspartyl peptidase/L-asparaginase family protein n=1 Tax=Glaciecola sp. SC05 TaxID=1987355 RepID=UPI003526CAA0
MALKNASNLCQKTLRATKFKPLKHLLITAALCALPFLLHAHNHASTKSPVAIAIHGGAGTITKANLSDEQEAEYKLAINTALDLGYEQLAQGKDGLDAIVAAIKYLEDSPLFNAGIGAVYTFDGQHELDASIMRGDNLQAGAVASVTNIKNPIVAARLVMEQSVHVMLSGKGAEQFALEHGVEKTENTTFNTPRRFEALQRAKQRISESEAVDTQAYLENAEFNDFKFGTVGVVVLDANGNISAGTSTGGMTAKRYGRVGDSPIIGSGTYADNTSCAVSATGHGEYFIRYNVAADICARMKYQKISLEQAANTVIHDVLLPAGGTGGIIAIDAKGNIAMPFNTEGMYRGSIDIDGNKTVLIYKD